MRLSRIGLIAVLIVFSDLFMMKAHADDSSDRLLFVYDSTKCVNLYKPYKIVPKEDSAEFANFLDLQFDEVYRRVREAICNAILGNCVLRGDTLMMCVWPDTCRRGNDATSNTDAIYDKIIVNTHILELRHDQREDMFGPTTDEYPPSVGSECYRDTVFISEPILRFRTRNGDSLDILGPDDIGSAATTVAKGPVSRISLKMPENTLMGTSMLVFKGGQANSVSSASYKDSNNTNVTASGVMYPIRGLVQGGIWKGINTNQILDTIIFATQFSDSHGGADTSSGPMMTNLGSGLSAVYAAGFKYSNYTAVIDWGDGASGFIGDSLWINSKTDSSIIIGIQYSATARTVNFMTFGKWRRSTP